MIYIASPYSHPKPEIREARYLDVMAYTAHLFRQKIWCHSPIVHCHELAKIHILPTDAAFWFEYNEHVMKRCDELWILQLPGWNESKGVKMEMDFWTSYCPHKLSRLVGWPSEFEGTPVSSSLS